MTQTTTTTRPRAGELLMDEINHLERWQFVLHSPVIQFHKIHQSKIVKINIRKEQKYWMGRGRRKVKNCHLDGVTTTCISMCAGKNKKFNVNRKHLRGKKLRACHYSDSDWPATMFLMYYYGKGEQRAGGVDRTGIRKSYTKEISGSCECC